MNMPVLLIVDDEKPTRDALRMGFQDDYEVYTASNLSQAVTLMREESPDLVLTDLRLGGENGMDVLKSAAALSHPPQSIMMTAYGSVDAAVEAMKQGAYDFVTKPLNLDAVEWCSNAPCIPEIWKPPTRNSPPASRLTPDCKNCWAVLPPWSMYSP